MRKINTSEPNVHLSVIVGFALIVIAFISLTVLATLQIQYFHKDATKNSATIKQIVAVNSMGIAARNRMELMLHLIHADSNEDSFDENVSSVRDSMSVEAVNFTKSYQIIIENETDQDAYNLAMHILSDARKTNHYIQQFMDLIEFEEFDTAHTLLYDIILPQQRHIFIDIIGVNEHTKKHVNVALKETNEIGKVIQMKLMAISIIGCMFIILIASYVYRHISVTQRKLLTAKKVAEKLAMHDVLTGLPNRSFLHESMTQAFALSDREEHLCAVMVIDLNGFKQVNDTLGHAAGDSILQQVSERLITTCRQTDVVARMGGDEFGVLLYNVESQRKSELMAERVINAFYEPFYVDEQPFVLGAAIGIALYPLHALDHNDILKRADVAMYEAKENKIGYVVYENMLDLVSDEQSLKTASMLAYLRKAVKNDEFLLHYQPKVNVKTGKIDSVEALIRWNHPILGLVRPDEFIPLAENSGNIHQITLWVIEEGCRQLGEWKKQGHDLGLSINVSAQCLYDTHLMSTIAENIMENNLHPEQLTVELTETAIMSNAETAIKILISLTVIGIKLSIDDFGTGHSSLMYLQKLPIHEIKIDRSFITDIAQSYKNIKIVKSIIGLAHSIDAVVVAEGVETEEDQTILSEMNCDSLQGYYISRPIPGCDIIKFIEEREHGTV